MVGTWRVVVVAVGHDIYREPTLVRWMKNPMG